MGIYRNQRARLALRIIGFVVLLFFAPLMPWWLTFTLASIFVFARISSAELIAIGLFLDFFLLDAQNGVFGLFYSLFFFSVVLISVAVGLLQQKHER